MSKLGDLFNRWIRQAQRLFHTLVGLAFLVLALAGAILSFTEWHSYQGNQNNGLAHFGMFLGFTILLIILSLYSFVKARSVR